MIEKVIYNHSNYTVEVYYKTGIKRHYDLRKQKLPKSVKLFSTNLFKTERWIDNKTKEYSL